MVSDDEILAAQAVMAAESGIFGEPASAAPLAGLLKLKSQGHDFSRKVIVCVVTGNGLKDTDIALKKAPDIAKVPADIAKIERELGF